MKTSRSAAALLVAASVGAGLLAVAQPAYASSTVPIRGTVARNSAVWSDYPTVRTKDGRGNITFVLLKIPTGGACVRILNTKGGVISNGACTSSTAPVTLATDVLNGTKFRLSARKRISYAEDETFGGNITY